MKQKINYTGTEKKLLFLQELWRHLSSSLLFLVPSKTSVGQHSGLGIILSNFVQLPLSTITMIMNVMLLIIGFLTCGKEFGVKTIYTSIMLPVFLGVYEKAFSGLSVHDRKPGAGCGLLHSGCERRLQYSF